MGRRSPLGVMLLALQWATNQPWSPDMWISSIVSAKYRTSVTLYCQMLLDLCAARKNAQWCNLNSIVPKDGGDGIGIVAVDCVYGIAVCGSEHLPHLLVAHLFC